MHFGKCGHQRQNISMTARDSGQVEWVTGLFWILILCILLAAQLQIISWYTTGMYMEDALAASNLASALIDIQEYGKTHTVRIPDAGQAYLVYQDALRDNLQLDEQWMCENKTLISGRVEIADYIIYNVDHNIVTANRVGPGGYVTEIWTGERGAITAPDGSPITHTGIYSEIQFPVHGFPGISVMAHKGKLVDIVSERREE